MLFPICKRKQEWNESQDEAESKEGKKEERERERVVIGSYIRTERAI